MVLLEMQSTLNVSVAGSLLAIVDRQGYHVAQFRSVFWRILVPQAQPMKVL